MYPWRGLWYTVRICRGLDFLRSECGQTMISQNGRHCAIPAPQNTLQMHRVVCNLYLRRGSIAGGRADSSLPQRVAAKRAGNLLQALSNPAATFLPRTTLLFTPRISLDLAHSLAVCMVYLFHSMSGLRIARSRLRLSWNTRAL